MARTFVLTRSALVTGVVLGLAGLIASGSTAETSGASDDGAFNGAFLVPSAAYTTGDFGERIGVRSDRAAAALRRLLGGPSDIADVVPLAESRPGALDKAFDGGAIDSYFGRERDVAALAARSDGAFVVHRLESARGQDVAALMR